MYLLKNYFYHEFLNNFSKLLICEIPDLEISNTIFFHFFVASQNTGILINFSFCPEVLQVLKKKADPNLSEGKHSSPKILQTFHIWSLGILSDYSSATVVR